MNPKSISPSGVPPTADPKRKSFSSSEIRVSNSVLDAKLQSSSDQPSLPSASAPSYAQRLKSSLRNLRKISNPTFLVDGTPVVQAPASVLLKTAELWKDHIVAHFHGTCPPPGKIFADLNPVWGKFGDITVRMVSETSCLIFVPNVQSREWVLQVGYWQVDHCAVSVFPWSVEGSLQDLELKFAPTWVILKNIPPQLYSLDDISVVASAVGEPLHTEKSRLDPYHFGDTKVKVEIDLSVTLPNVVEVRDSENNSVRIKIEYPKLPPKCCNCGKFGHLMNRCPKPPMKRKPQLQTQEKEQEKVKVAMAPPSVSVSAVSAQMDFANTTLAQDSEATHVQSAGPSPSTQKRARSRSRARERRRSLSALPSHRIFSSYSEGEEGEIVEVSKAAEVTLLRQERARDSGKKAECKNDFGSKEEEYTYSDPPQEECIWLKPKAARRAQKIREQRAAWNASGGRLLKQKIPLSLNRGGTSGRKQNL